MPMKSGVISLTISDQLTVILMSKLKTYLFFNKYTESTSGNVHKEVVEIA